MLLIDTHILLWAISDPEKLTAQEHKYLASGNNPICFSIASVWEIAIKAGLQKLPVPPQFKELLLAQNFIEIPIDFDIVWKVKDLAMHHADPFDRLIIATAQIHHLSIMTRDTVFAKYDVSLFQS